MTFLPFAHALAARQDLPIPAWLFAWGASIVLIASFFALAAAWRKPRLEEARWRPLGAGLSRALVSAPVQVLCGLVGIFGLAGHDGGALGAVIALRAVWRSGPAGSKR